MIVNSVGVGGRTPGAVAVAVAVVGAAVCTGTLPLTFVNQTSSGITRAT